MLKPKRKITKQELKKDPFLEFIADSQKWISDRKKTIYQVVIGVIAIVVVVYFFSNNRAKNTNEAKALLGKALLSQDLGDTENTRFELQNLVDDFGGTKSGIMGAYYLGKSFYDENNYDESLKYLSDYTKDGENSELLSASYKMLASMAINVEDMESAEEYLNKGASIAKNTVYEDEIALMYADQLITNNKSDRALKIIEEILEKDDILFSTKKMAEELKGKIEG